MIKIVSMLLTCLLFPRHRTSSVDTSYENEFHVAFAADIYCHITVRKKKKRKQKKRKIVTVVVSIYLVSYNSIWNIFDRDYNRVSCNHSLVEHRYILKIVLIVSTRREISRTLKIHAATGFHVPPRLSRRRIAPWRWWMEILFPGTGVDVCENMALIAKLELIFHATVFIRL